MTDAPHTYFTVGLTAYLRNLTREDLRSETVAVHYQKAPVRHDDGRTSISLTVPVLITSLYLQDQQAVAARVAKILNKHWDDPEFNDGEPEPSCAACGKLASEHLKDGDCKKFTQETAHG